MGSIQEVAEPPTFGITCLRWSPDGESLLVGSWDRVVRVYQRSSEDHNTLLLRHFLDAEKDVAILDVCWSKPGSSFVYAVCTNGEVFEYDISTAGCTVLSKHDAGSSKVAYSTQHNILVSTSWDGTMHVHDPETKTFIRVKLSNKAFAFSLFGERAVVAMAERKVAVFELQALRAVLDQNGTINGSAEALEVQPWQERDSSLKFMSRAVACMPDGTGFAISSVEGRVGVEWFDPELQQNTYAFKCHRQTHDLPDGQGGTEEVDVVYPVNALTFHPTFGTFATGGGDGAVALWDAKSKRRVKLYSAHDGCVNALDISPDGKSLAIGTGPGVEEIKLEKMRTAEGLEGLDADGLHNKAEEETYVNPDSKLIKIFVREFAEGEAKAKEKKEKK